MDSFFMKYFGLWKNFESRYFIVEDFGVEFIKIKKNIDIMCNAYLIFT